MTTRRSPSWVQSGLVSGLILGCTVPSAEHWNGHICVETHASQPMVADVWLEPAPDSDAVVSMPDDPGVQVQAIGVDEMGRMGYRLRGLPPESALDLQVAIDDELLSQSFSSETPLDGFIPRFEVAQLGDHHDGLRLFDLSAWPLISEGGAFVVDAQGVTRFFLPLRPQSGPGHAAVPAGLTLLDDGSLLYIQDDAIQVVDEFGQRQVHILAADVGLLEFHHDVTMLPSGNFLTLSRSYRTVDMGDGQMEEVCGDLVVEITPEGERVWSWDAFDHLDPTRRREGTEISEYPIFHPKTGEEVEDWTHANALVYRAEEDRILLSLRHQDWLVQLDHSQGDVIWRLGEDGDFELSEGGNWFYHQHAPEWQPDGSLLLYDNGVDAPGLTQEEWRSRAVRYRLDTESWSAEEAWTEADQGYSSLVAGDADLLPNGNLQVVDATLPFSEEQFFPTAARIREVDPETGEWTWWLEGPDYHFIFRAMAIDHLPGESL